MRPLLIILAIIAILAAVKIFILDRDTKKTETLQTEALANSDKRIPVDVYIAEEVNKNYTVYASGTLVPNEEVEIKSEVSGRLIQLNINEGKYIQKGSLIAKLYDEDLKAQIKKIEFEEELAEQIEARQNKLLEIDAISKEEYDMAVNRVNTLSTDKELLQLQLEKTEVRAPFSGVMGLKSISEGAYITPATVLASLVQTSPLKIDFSLPEKYSNRVTVGHKIIFEVDGRTEKFEGKIIALDPRIDEDLRTLNVRAVTSNRGTELLPGMFVRVEVPLGDENLMMIPTQAIVPILKGKKVFVMKNGFAEEVEVTTGLRTEDRISVDSGLQVGDSLIVSSLMSIENGTSVKLRNVVP